MFIQRALISLTLGPLALYLIYLGGFFYFLPIALILVAATAEYVQLTRKLGWQTSLPVLLPPVIALWVAAQWLDGQLAGALMAAGLLWILAYALWLYERNRSATVLADWGAMVVGLLLLGWIGGHFFRLRGLEEMAWQWTMLAMLSTWVTDSAAYLVGKFLAGRLFGRHQLAPRLSPNKTIEGYVGGIVLGTAVTVLLTILLQLPLFMGLAIGLLVSIVSLLGDLGISLLKRQAGVKDSGHLFPGHGGALDRIDSLVWSVTMAYYFIVLVA
jgi:phosphatidate cytidylyltransferase